MSGPATSRPCGSTSDADGKYLGTTTLEGYPVVSEDGQTFIDDMSRVVVTDPRPARRRHRRDPPDGRPAGDRIRMGPGDPGVPDVSAAAASAAP